MRGAAAKKYGMCRPARRAQKAAESDKQTDERQLKLYLSNAFFYRHYQLYSTNCGLTSAVGSALFDTSRHTVIFSIVIQQKI